MPRPPLPTKLRRSEIVWTAFRKSEIDLVTAVQKQFKITTRAEVVRECVLSVLERRPARWEQ